MYEDESRESREAFLNRKRVHQEKDKSHCKPIEFKGADQWKPQEKLIGIGRVQASEKEEEKTKEALHPYPKSKELKEVAPKGTKEQGSFVFWVNALFPYPSIVSMPNMVTFFQMLFENLKKDDKEPKTLQVFFLRRSY